MPEVAAKVRTLRVLASFALFAVAVGGLWIAARGLAPVFPAAAAILRALLHPAVILILGALLVLVRLGGSSRTPRRERPPPRG